MRFRISWVALFMLLILIIAGCGEQHADVPIYIMLTKRTLANDPSLSLQQAFERKIGISPTISVEVSEEFSKVKLNFEIIKGDDSIYVVPEEQFISFAQTGNLISLDDEFDTKLYPEGVVETLPDDSNNSSQLEKHLYGIPIENLHWLEKFGYSSKKLFAFVSPKANNIAMAKQVLRRLSEQ